jgi:hypothetical protein
MFSCKNFSCNRQRESLDPITGFCNVCQIAYLAGMRTGYAREGQKRCIDCGNPLESAAPTEPLPILVLKFHSPKV